VPRLDRGDAPRPVCVSKREGGAAKRPMIPLPNLGPAAMLSVSKVLAGGAAGRVQEREKRRGLAAREAAGGGGRACGAGGIACVADCAVGKGRSLYPRHRLACLPCRYAVKAGNATDAARAALSATSQASAALLAAADPSAFWSAVSADATSWEQDKTGADIAGLPLWSDGQPDQLESLWQDLRETLLGLKQEWLLLIQQNWKVWTSWYEDRLKGRVREEEHELVYVRIGDDLWNQGPAIVNAEIKRQMEGSLLIQETAEADDSVTAEVVRRTDELGPHGPVVQLSARSMAHGSGGASMRPHGPAEGLPPPEPPFPTSRKTEPELPPIDWHVQFGLPPEYQRRVEDFKPPPPPLEAIPEQEPVATTFGVNPQGLIDVVPDPPAHETAADALQREYYDELRRKAQALIELGSNQLGELTGPAARFRDSLPERIEDLSISRSWSRGNTLRSRLKAHDLSMNNGEPDPARLPPLVAETLRDLVHTWNIFIVGDPKGRELDEIRLGPQEMEAAKQVIAAAAPVVAAIESSENVATPLAIETVVEQAQAAKNAPAGIDGDQAIELSRKTSGNFVAELLRRAYALVLGEAAFGWKESRAGLYRYGAVAAAIAAYNNWPAIVSFVAKNADALKEFVTAAWHNPTLVEIIDRIVGMLH
jgi:hypothetical protein